MELIGWLLLLCAVAAIVIALRVRRETGVPWARVRMQDTHWQRMDQPLRSLRYGVIGKPDYVVETRHGLVPIEVKPSRTATAPYDSDLMQLAAYCLLIEDTTGHAPPYGLLRYAQRTFKLPYTSNVRSALLALLDDMRRDGEANDVARSHHQRARCRGCGFREECADRL